MYALTPLRVYVLDRVQDDRACVARMERMLNALGHKPDTVVRITEENLPEVIGELATLWPPDVVPPGRVRSFMRPLVFTTMDLSYNRPDVTPLLERCPPGTPPEAVRKILGHMTTATDQHPHQLDQRLNYVCWPTYNFGTVTGCTHGCLYCSAGRDEGFIAIALNLDLNDCTPPSACFETRSDRALIAAVTRQGHPDRIIPTAVCDAEAPIAPRASCTAATCGVAALCRTAGRSRPRRRLRASPNRNPSDLASPTRLNGRRTRSRYRPTPCVSVPRRALRRGRLAMGRE